MNPIDKYVEGKSFQQMKKIDDAFWLFVKPRTWWIPVFLYNAIIKEHVEIVSVI